MAIIGGSYGGFMLY
ncbi:MAG: hypothetical protein AB8U16_02320 [Rickettsiales endosymbiont of Dermacentor nuttalli]